MGSVAALLTRNTEVGSERWWLSSFSSFIFQLETQLWWDMLETSGQLCERITKRVLKIIFNPFPLFFFFFYEQFRHSVTTIYISMCSF